MVRTEETEGRAVGFDNRKRNVPIRGQAGQAKNVAWQGTGRRNTDQTGRIHCSTKASAVHVLQSLQGRGFA